MEEVEAGWKSERSELSDRSTDFSEVTRTSAKPDGVSVAAKTPEHLSAQDADFPQSPFPGLAQSCPCGQQSD